MKDTAKNYFYVAEATKWFKTIRLSGIYTENSDTTPRGSLDYLLNLLKVDHDGIEFSLTTFNRVD